MLIHGVPWLQGDLPTIRFALLHRRMRSGRGGESRSCRTLLSRLVVSMAAAERLSSRRLSSFLSVSSSLSLSPPARSCGWPARSHSPSRTPLSRTRSQNELGILEFIHALVETLDKYFENVCELDIMFNLEKAHFIVEEMVMNGQIVETNKANILKPIKLIEDGS